MVLFDGGTIETPLNVKVNVYTPIIILSKYKYKYKYKYKSS